jgi:hypothetical protein
LRQRLRDLKELHLRAEEVKRTAAEELKRIRSTINRLLGKKKKNPKNDATNNTNVSMYQPTSADHSEGPLDSTSASLSRVFGPEGNVPGQPEPRNLPSLLQSPLPSGQNQSEGEGREPDDPSIPNHFYE